MKYKNSANRSYYAIFHAMRAVNALEGFDSKKHSGVITYFRKNFIKTAKLDIEISKFITSAFNMRNNADYEDFYILSKEDVEEQFVNAQKFLAAVDNFLKPFFEASCDE